MSRQRIQALDGLRCLAAVGVLWIHTWTAHHNPRFYAGPVDLTDIMAIGGNGVDLFFVISGFCMYYFYGANANFSYHDFFRFLVKRWVRLSPAFYSAVVIYSLVSLFIYHQPVNFILNVLHGLFYLNDILGGYFTAIHFWTLTTEWQFYFTIPFLLLFQNKLGFTKAFLVIFGSVFLVGVTSICILKSGSDFLIPTIFNRGIEFACGILAAKVLLQGNFQPRRRILWILGSLVILYTGRIFISQHVLSLSTNFYNLLRLFGFTLMGLGFAGILYLSLTPDTLLNQFLSNKAFKSLGRVSYSFYLFHILVQEPVVRLVIKYMPFLTGISAPVVSTCISIVILYPVAKLSFHFLEKPFLNFGNLSTK